jgi:mono/diheme cytochrome c family protein
MNLTRPSVFLGIALITGGCLTTLPYATDSVEVASRYPHRFQGECSSWLRSHKTGYTYCASPKLGGSASEAAAGPVGPPEEDGEYTKDALMARGEEVYGQICVACHQANGMGVPGAFPPLAGAGEYYGTAENQSYIIINGLAGPIEVLGQQYNGAMPGQGNVLSTYAIAAVGTYVRNSFGNNDGMVTEEDVLAARARD